MYEDMPHHEIAEKRDVLQAEVSKRLPKITSMNEAIEKRIFEIHGVSLHDTVSIVDAQTGESRALIVLGADIVDYIDCFKVIDKKTAGAMSFLRDINPRDKGYAEKHGYLVPIKALVLKEE